MATTVGNYGSTAGINAGNLRAPTLANYGDALAPLANRFNKLEDIVNKQIEIKKEREYQNTRDEAARVFQRSMQDNRQNFQKSMQDDSQEFQSNMQDDRQDFQKGLEGIRFNNNLKLEGKRHEYGLEDLKKRHGYTLEEIAARGRQQRASAKYSAGLKISTARQLAKLNKQAEKESGINIDFNSMIHTVGISPDEAKRRIDELKTELVNKKSQLVGSKGIQLDTSDIPDKYKDYFSKVAVGLEATKKDKTFLQAKKELGKDFNKFFSRAVKVHATNSSILDTDEVKALDNDFKTKSKELLEQSKGFHIDPLKTSQNVLKTKQTVIEKASRGELNPKTANNIVRILDSMEKQYFNEANKEYKTKEKYAGEALVKEKEIKKNNLKQYKDLVIEYSKTMPVEQAKEKAKKIMNDKTYLGN